MRGSEDIGLCILVDSNVYSLNDIISFFFLIIRRSPGAYPGWSSAAFNVYKGPSYGLQRVILFSHSSFNALHKPMNALVSAPYKYLQAHKTFLDP